jgi:hypothetical protein
MTASFYIRMVAVILLATGALALLLPETYANIVGIESTEASTLWMRFFAATKLGYAVALWAGSGAAPAIRRGLGWSIVLAFGLDIVLDILASANGLMNALAWTAVVADTAIIAGAIWVIRSPGE